VSRRQERKERKRLAKANRTPAEKAQLTRRRFLKAGGGLGVLAVGGFYGVREGRLFLVDTLMTTSQEGGGAKPKDPNLWFEIAATGAITFHSPKMDMGQGINSALMQIAAEELEVRWDQIRVVPGEPRRGLNVGEMSTFGSSSVTSMFKPVRETAATMREMLRAEGAVQLGIPAANLVVKEGRCISRNDAAKALTYGEIVAAKKTPWTVPKDKAALKDPKDFVSIGKDMPRADVLDKLRGKPVYAYDVRLDGILYGAVARPPSYGAKLKSAAPGQAESHPGVVKVVIDKGANFAGVVAKTRTQARAAVAKLELQWAGGSTASQADVEKLLTARRGEGVSVRRHGDAADALSKGASVEADYRTPMAAHAHLEPISATVHVTAKIVEAWVPTQSPQADTSALGPWSKGREVVVHPMQMGGSFGRKGMQTMVAEAARLSAAVGQPVHVGWTRHEEMQQSFYRPVTNTYLRGKVSTTGKIEAVQQVSVTGTVTNELPGIAFSVLGFDPGAGAGLFLDYAISNYSVRASNADLPVRTGIWRGVGLYPNVFALESFIDELAVAAKKDPLEFRLMNFGNDKLGTRSKRVLEDVRTRSDWDTPAAAGRGRGVAVSNSTGTHVAMVAEVSMTNGAIVVERVTASIDCGLVVNPVNAGLQAKGSIVMGMSSTLVERLTVKNGAIEQRDFDDYPLLTLKQTPRQIDVHFIETTDAPQGMGEPVIGPVGACIANALFALTGQRQRSLPLVAK
jgi:isoquinoline 1-oxidoreductase subunit beta